MKFGKIYLFGNMTTGQMYINVTLFILIEEHQSHDLG